MANTITKKPKHKHIVESEGDVFKITQMIWRSGGWELDYHCRPVYVTNHQLFLHEIAQLFEDQNLRNTGGI